jgi:hypothetical protein
VYYSYPSTTNGSSPFVEWNASDGMHYFGAGATPGAASWKLGTTPQGNRIPVVGSQTLAAATVIRSDLGDVVKVDAAGAITHTGGIADGLVDGQTLELINIGANTITITVGSAYNIAAMGNVAMAQDRSLTLRWIASRSYWVATGKTP